MKKSLLAIAFAMVTMVGSAQVYVGGSLDLDLAGNKTTSASNFSLSSFISKNSTKSSTGVFPSNT